MKHSDQVLNLLRKQVGNVSEVNEIRDTAKEVVRQWIDPLTSGSEQINGLIYGLVQSGKTGVLTVTGAMGADAGYDTIILLTSDIDPLYEQTFGRAQQAFPAMDILGKKDLNDQVAFLQRVRSNKCVIVVTKNDSILKKLIQNFQSGRLRGVTCLIIDDEADQASLNTKAKLPTKTRSTINGHIAELRGFFHKNTYLQVTATPQALFLQEGTHAFRPKFTVLSHPGSEYVGGEDFFSETSKLVREFPLDELTVLSAGAQPTPSTTIPASLLFALDVFMIGATYKRIKDIEENCAFLCHVSTKTRDHEHIVDLLRKYKVDLAEKLKSKNASVIKRLRKAYDDLATSDAGIKSSNFDDLLDTIQFLSPGIMVKMVNGQTDEDVAVRSPYNLFVGGNKLGRGVTIKNLLVSYYGRHPKTPQADTVLQHARMYGYRRKDFGLLRLFLPNELHVVFKAINNMEQTLRELISKKPNEEFRGIYLENGLNSTRKSVLPGSVGIYSGGQSYNPSQVLRTPSVSASTKKIDNLVHEIPDKHYAEFTISDFEEIIKNIIPDATSSEQVWDSLAIASSAVEYAKLNKLSEVYVYVDRDRDLTGPRRETQGILSGGEADGIPKDRITLFLLRTVEKGSKKAAWWPQLRFPDGRYAFAFSM
jgi:hypothetical protein